MFFVKLSLLTFNKTQFKHLEHNLAEYTGKRKNSCTADTFLYLTLNNLKDLSNNFIQYSVAQNDNKQAIERYCHKGISMLKEHSCKEL